MNVFVVVTTDGELKPYIASDMSDAIAQYDMEGGDADEIAGAFVYGQHATLVEAIKEVWE